MSHRRLRTRVALGAVSSAGVPMLDPASRAALQAKLNDAAQQYRAAAVQARQLLGRYQLSLPLYRIAMDKAKGGRTISQLRLNAGELASLVLGVMVKVEAGVMAATALLAVAQDARAASVVDRTITATLRVTRTLNELGSTARAVQSVMGGLGQVSGAGIAVAVGVLLTMTGVGAVPGIVLIAGGIGYMLSQSVSELDSARTDAEAMTRDINRICPPGPNRDACIALYQQNYRLAAEQQRMTNEGLIAATGAAGADLVRATNPLLQPLADALPYLVAGGGVVVLGTFLYFMWPLLTGFRRGTRAVVGNVRDSKAWAPQFGVGIGGVSAKKKTKKRNAKPQDGARDVLMQRWRDAVGALEEIRQDLRSVRERIVDAEEEDDDVFMRELEEDEEEMETEEDDLIALIAQLKPKVLAARRAPKRAGRKS